QAIAALAELHGGDAAVQRFAAAAGQALARRGPEVIAAWAELAAALAFDRRRRSTLLDELPEAPGLSDPELVQLLTAVKRVAAIDRERAGRLLERAPLVVGELPPRLRPGVLALGDALARSPEALLGAVEILGPVVRRLPAAARHEVIEQGLRVARALPAAASAYLRTVLRVGEAVGWKAAFDGFVERGLALAEAEPRAALAFFALESRSGRAYLARHDLAVRLEDVEITLRGYLRLIGAAGASPVGVDGSGLFPRVVEEPGAIPVGARADVFPTWEENFTLLKLQATLAASWASSGTFELDLAAWSGDESESGRGLQDLFRHFVDPEAAAGMFAHLEAIRLFPALRVKYPGLAADVGALRRRIFPDEAPLAEHGVSGAILFLALGGEPEEVPWQAPWGDALASFAARARAGSARVRDTADLTALLCERLAAGELVRIYGVENFELDELSFAHLLDPEGDDRPVGASDRPPPGRPDDELREASGERSDETAPATVTDPELLRAFLEQHPDVKVRRAEEPIDPIGLFVAGLTGISGGDENQLGLGSRNVPDHVLAVARHGHRVEGTYLHDEWDYSIADYRAQWCRVHEVAVDGDDGEFFTSTLARYAEVLPEVRRQFQRVKPEGYRTIRGLLDGEDFDLNATVMAMSDLRARRTASPKLYVARQREEREVATLFLLDMSASTDEETEPLDPVGVDRDPDAFTPPPRARTARPRRIIDIQKEALVIMAQALEEIGDLYAIYGFSGHGRDCVEFFDVKSFNESLSHAVRGRIGALEPQRSTRMGAALRQAVTKLRAVPSRAKHMILLSDGFPQDFDYGDDRRSNVYGLRDTAMALREAQQAGIAPFCITVDRAGHDYLREMCDAERYMVIDDIAALPRELPKIYAEAVRGTGIQ
ncbi:MAG TPA: VWA domain-containing protein, partial [Candidatus Bathyarchaeia archaeon]|nr:VWA domain-containing protein [Candidatus Bathyarchaeia archaeon]